jgi:hypothetical protein
MPSRPPLTSADAVVATGAVLLVPVAAASIRLMPLPRAMSLVSRLARCLPMPSISLDTARIVNGAASRAGARCLTTAVVVHAILGRAGVASQVVIAAARQDGQLKSHAWVECDGRPVAGSTFGWNTLWRSGS